MGMASPGGASAGVARGVVEMDISQLHNAAAQARQLGQTFERALNGVNAPAQRAQASINALSRDIMQLAGIASTVALARQFAQFAIQADAAATAYRRQSIAALDLAGSQNNLNRLLDEYNKVTGNQVDKATALNAVTRLRAMGFADSTAELNEFVTAARGSALALGKTQEYITQELQLTLANTSERRLDQIGLGIAEVDARVKELRASNSALTREMAFSQAVLGLMNEKYGALAKSTQAQATGAERASKAWKDLSLSFGNLVGPTVDTVASKMAALFNLISTGFDHSSQAIQDFGKWLQWLGSVTLPEGFRQQGRELLTGLGYRLAPSEPRRIGGPSRNERNRPVSVGGGRTEAQTDLIRQWAADVQAIEREAGMARVEATRQYESQRSQTIAQYELGILRDAEDFARSRQRQAEQLARQIADVRADAQNREALQVRDYTEKIAELRSDANERIAEIEESYAESREKAERDHRDRLMGAAARLDAVGVFEEQRRYQREQEEAKHAHGKRIGKEKDNLQERIDDERKAHERRLADARAADEERIQEMRASLAEQQRLEDEDRAIQRKRQEEDHRLQLAQMAQAQAERMAQISEQAANEKKALDEKFTEELAATGLHNENWLKIQELRQKESLKLFDEFWKEIQKRFAIQGPKTKEEAEPRAFPDSFALGGWVQRGGIARVHAGEFVVPAAQARSMAGGMSRSVTIGDIHVYGTPGMDEATLGRAVRREVEGIFSELAQ